MQVKGGLNASETNEATAPREQATLEKEENTSFYTGVLTGLGKNKVSLSLLPDRALCLPTFCHLL